MKLNGWQWAGVALSIVWALGAGIHTRDADVQRADDFAKYAYKVCTDSKALHHDADLSSCEKEKREHVDTFMQGSDGNVAFAALAPIPIGWLACFVLLYAWRIQVAGFRATVPWSAMSRPKKAFAIFCGLAVTMTVGMAAVIVMNLYVDTLVPVALAPKAMVIKSGDLVTAEGTWISTGLSADSALAFPLQTSRIECSREAQRCTEARASVSGNLMSAELVEYEMQSWTNAAIVLKREGLCSEDVYTIDLNTEVVSGAGRRTNSEMPICKTSGADKWSYRLSDGFPVYWELRTKARPLPLRVFQSLFGH